MAANTLLGYFKDAIVRHGESTKYFNRDFLARFVADYNESKRAGEARYARTFETKFYQLNSTAYCVFLEEYYAYRKAMDRLAAAGW